MAVKNVGKLDDTEIKQWVKNNIRFDARADGNGLYLRFRETDKNPVFLGTLHFGTKSGKRKTLLPFPPLRTVLESFPSYGSSLC